MSKCGLMGPWIKRFLLDHLIEERNLSKNTQRSYRDTLALLMPYAATERNKPVDRLDVFDLSSEVLRGFLDHLEQNRRCSIRTRNQRLAALHAMARFIAERSPEHIAWCGQIRAVPFKRFNRNELSYLDKPEMDAILAAPDRRTAQGRRDHALLLFLYNSGARVSEAASLLIGDLNLRPNQLGDVQLRGKGRKIRRCPLWPATVDELLARVRARSTRLPQPARRSDHTSRHSLDASQPRPYGIGFTSVAAPQADQPAYDPAHDRDASAPLRRRYQHHPRMARSCLHRHHQHLRRGRSAT
jgi:integrase/recombinase XerD